MGQNKAELRHQTLAAWEPGRVLRSVSAAEALLSRGFLRSRPEKWFPGFAALWLPLAHALGCSLRIGEVKPVRDLSLVYSEGCFARVGNQAIVVAADPAVLQTIADLVLPGVGQPERSILTEYLARRLIFTLTNSWTGPQLGKVTFLGQEHQAPLSGAVKLSFYLDDRLCTVWVGLTDGLVEMLDGLWRRQVQSVRRSTGNSVKIDLEIAQLALPLLGLSDHLKKGAVIDLGIAASDSVIIRCDNKPWLPGRLCQIDGVFGVETSSGPVSSVPIPEGATRLSVELGSFVLDAVMLAELGQVGALCSSELPLSNRVAMLINHEKVAEATLSTLANRFVLVVE